MQSQNKTLLSLVIIFALVAILFSAENSRLNDSVRLENERIEKLKNNLASLPISAKAVSVYDITRGRKIYGKNDDVPLPIASLAKIMTVVVALNNREPREIISLTPEAISQDGDYGLLVAEKWKIEDLAKLTLISSSNDGVYALVADTPNFLETVNSKTWRIGMGNSSFLNFTGLDLDLETAGAFASAEEVNMMAIYGLKAYPEIFSVTTQPEIILQSESGFSHKFKNTNIVINKIPNLLFSKTGYTDVAGGSLAIIFKDKKGDEIAVTLLGSTFDDRFTDMGKIVEILYNS